MSWYLAQLKPNCAQIAERNLKRQGFNTFLPLETVTRKHKNTFRTVKRPLFPGYLFVSFNVASGGWRTIRSTQGVARLVCFGNEPTQVPGSLVSELKGRCGEGGQIQSPTDFKAGDAVRLVSGPFANLVASILEVAADQRVWLLMDVMGSSTRVAVGAQQVRAV